MRQFLYINFFVYSGNQQAVNFPEEILIHSEKLLTDSTQKLIIEYSEDFVSSTPSNVLNALLFQFFNSMSLFQFSSYIMTQRNV